MKKLATIDLPRTNTNAFEVLARCQTAAELAGAEQARIQTFLEDAVQGDYEHLLRVVNTHFEVSRART
ncbi:hypothetical protein D1823_13680 [Ruegeria sp. AD91A]|uniref:hypothetical protein n=1 Tax=Ruegeria sp. AD91A TaxID=2293862 RepID=UPI000E4D40E3|nr:hypothetical protein [Ruegeria sp. AD91A]AXT27533.1 hypothetical protein D1823_13680 [Ruegeria sp. AD91A]